jgi:hypothetical protein
MNNEKQSSNEIKKSQFFSKVMTCSLILFVILVFFFESIYINDQ